MNARLLISLSCIVSVLLPVAPAFSQAAQSDVVKTATSLAGYTVCDPDAQNFIGEPTGQLLAKYKVQGDRIVLPTFRECKNSVGESQVWRVLPSPGGPGINNERFVIVDGRKQWNTHLMWIEPNRSYRPHDNYWPGKTNQSGTRFSPVNSLTFWEKMNATLPFIPQRVVYFGDSRGVSRVGFTELLPIPGLEKSMHPLRYDSVVFGVNGSTFSTSQNYILSFNFSPKKHDFLEVAYYESHSATKDVQSMNESARVAYIPVFEVGKHERAYRVLTKLVGATGMQVGSFGEYARVLAPFASYLKALESIGWDEEGFRKRCDELRDAGGLCLR